jgi:transcriptional regulator with XRE-family HTH domain
LFQITRYKDTTFFEIPKIINIFAHTIKEKTMEQINRLKVVLVEQNKTGKWLADSINKDVATISRWCSNVTQPPLKTLYDIAKLLDVDIKDLLVSTKKR